MSKIIFAFIIILSTGCAQITVHPAPSCAPAEVSYDSSYDYVPYTYGDYDTTYYSSDYGME